MRSDINPEILDQINKSNKPENIKKFIKETLKLEYKLSDQERPNVKNKYLTLIAKYNE